MSPTSSYLVADFPATTHVISAHSWRLAVGKRTYQNKFPGNSWLSVLLIRQNVGFLRCFAAVNQGE